MKCPRCRLINPNSALRCDCGYDFATGPVKASFVTKPFDFPLASRGDRLAAQFLDSLIGFAAIFVAMPFLALSEEMGVLVFLMACLFLFGYLLFADGLGKGQSYGKRIMKTSVVDATTGASCTYWKSFVRNILLMFLGFIDWVFILGSRRQRLGDMVANTIVIKDEKPSSETELSGENQKIEA